MSSFTGSSEASIYIIDNEYRICHFNQALKQVYPDIQCGDICYKVLCNEESPCNNCPLFSKQEDSVIFYNQNLQRWIEVSTGRIDWPGVGECSILLCREIREGNKNLLYNLTNASAYDELFELNITADTYRILYHLEGKYVIPPREGSLGDMVLDVSENMIHPDDREAFLKFWNMDDILSWLEESGSSHSLYGEFRKKLTNGEYCWVVQRVVPVRQNDNDEQIIMCFIQDINEQKLKALKVQCPCRGREAVYDGLTGLYRRSAFFNAAEEFLRSVQRENYCLTAVDIEHFKLFNEWYGREAGDRFLRQIAVFLKEAAEDDGIAGYMGSDDFCVILPDNNDSLDKLQRQIRSYIREDNGNAGFLPAFGVYSVTERAVPVITMYDRVSIALESVKGNYAQRICRYDSGMKQKMEENHKMLSEIQKALEQRQITFYAQPKCNMATGKIVGLESLVRWNHPGKGVISPGDFIPLLESNGFISNLDQYIWEDVCMHLKNWIDRGNKPVPVSVNVSRVDIYTLDVAEVFKGLVEKYSLPAGLLEIEITETAYADEYQMITKVVEDLRNSGFTVLMDDFGNGYSSLNMLKDVNVDVLKIDMKFLDMNEQSAGKGVGILEAIISMARLMGLSVIAEGVETKEQVNLLLELGCLYGQGYYFYHPMPIEEFETYLEDENNIDFRGMKAGQMDNLKMDELLDEDLFVTTMMNHVLGGLALYRVKENHAELLRVNDNYYKITGTNPVDLAEKKHNILEGVYKGDREKTINIFLRAYKDQLNGAVDEIRVLKSNGSVAWIQLHAYFLKEQDGEQIYYASLTDITEQREREKELEDSQQALATAVHISKNDESFMKLAEENRKAASEIFSQITSGGMIGGYCEEGFPLYFADNAMVKLLGYETYEEFAQAIHYRVINTIHPEDRARVACDIGPEYYDGLEYTTTYRMPKKDGTWFWTFDKGKVIKSENGTLAIVSACTDISDIMLAHSELARNNERLLHENQTLRGKVSLLAGQDPKNAVLVKWILQQAGINSLDWDMAENTLTIDNLVFKEEKEEIYRSIGCDAEIIRDFPSSILNNPNLSQDTKEHIKQFIEAVNESENGEGVSRELHLTMTDGRGVWVRVTSRVIADSHNRPVRAIGYFKDITEQKMEYFESQKNLKALQRDGLTGLYTRQAAIPKIKRYLKRMEEDNTAAIVMFDLDNFKLANDVFGHSYGDSMITKNAGRLKAFFREKDIICRIGGDEFLVLCKGIREEDMEKKLEKVICSMITVYDNGVRKIKFTVSAGYVMIPEHGREFDELYRKADIALFTAKLSGKSSFKKYHPKMKEIRYELADKGSRK